MSKSNLVGLCRGEWGTDTFSDCAFVSRERVLISLVDGQNISESGRDFLNFSCPWAKSSIRIMDEVLVVFKS